MAHAFVHLELNTDDVGKAKEFYRSLFGWSFTDMSMGDSSYTSLDTGAPPGGGVQLKPMPDAPTMWLPYISVADVAATVAKARSLGAEIVVEYMPIPGFGALAILRDPSSAPFGLWQVDPGSAGAAGGDRKAKKSKGDKDAARKAAKAKKAEKKAEKKAKKAEKKQKPDKAKAEPRKKDKQDKKDKKDKKGKKKDKQAAEEGEPRKKGKRRE